MPLSLIRSVDVERNIESHSLEEWGHLGLMTWLGTRALMSHDMEEISRRPFLQMKMKMKIQEEKFDH